MVVEVDLEFRASNADRAARHRKTDAEETRVARKTLSLTKEQKNRGVGRPQGCRHSLEKRIL